MNRKARIAFAARLYRVAKEPPFGSISGLALKCGVSRYTVQHWLKGETVPTGSTLSRLAEQGVDVGWLLIGKATEPYDGARFAEQASSAPCLTADELAGLRRISRNETSAPFATTVCSMAAALNHSAAYTEENILAPLRRRGLAVARQTGHYVLTYAGRRALSAAETCR